MQRVGVEGAEGPPVPIPNTEVKLSSAEDTWLATAWENREMPTLKKSFHPVGWLFFFCLDFLIGGLSLQHRPIKLPIRPPGNLG